MERERIICFVDGFNIYHALDQLRQPQFKWLDLHCYSDDLPVQNLR
jgi:hypothetical protein